MATARRRSRGFTLIELLVTITLIGVLMKIAVPAFGTWIRNAQVRSVTDALQTGIRTAQAEAVRRNRATVFFLTNAPGPTASALVNGRSWSLQTIALGTESPAYIGGGTLADVSSTVTIAGSNTAGSLNALCFNSNGYLFALPSGTGVANATCTAQNATFDITQPNGTSGVDRPLRVLVRVGGQLRVCDPNRPALSPSSPDGC